MLWGWPLGTATVRVTVTPLPREGFQLCLWLPHGTQARSLRHDMGASAGLGLGRCLFNEEDDWESASQKRTGGREEGGVELEGGGRGPGWAGGSDEVRV